MIDGLFNNGSMPVLERLVQFTGERHKQITHNIANFSTPHFRPKELSVDSFQEALGEAIDRRRDRTGGPNGELPLEDTRQLDFRRGGITPRPEAAGDNLMFHDRNDRSLEHQMQALAENSMAHNMGMRLLNNKFTMMERTIQERA